MSASKRETAQAAADNVKAAGQTVIDAAAQGTQSAQDAAQPYADAAKDKAQSAKDTLTPNQGTSGTRGLSGPGSASGVALGALCYLSSDLAGQNCLSW